MKTKLILIPFKIFVVAALPFYFLFRVLFPRPLWSNAGNNTFVIDPLANVMLVFFVLCAPVLLIGAIIQFRNGDSKSGVKTIFFAVAPTLALAAWIFIWAIAHAL